MPMTLGDIQDSSQNKPPFPSYSFASGSQLPVPENIQGAFWKDLCGEERRPPAKSHVSTPSRKHSLESSLEGVDSLRPHLDSIVTTQERMTRSQNYPFKLQSVTLDPGNCREIRYVYFKLLCFGVICTQQEINDVPTKFLAL